MKKISISVFAFLSFVFASGVFAQQPAPRVYTAADYDRAVKMLGFSTSPLVDHANVNPVFLPDGRFWYRVSTVTGGEVVLINPADGKRVSGKDLAAIGIVRAEPDDDKNAKPGEVKSPDGKRAAYIKDFNLWVRDIASGKEMQLTTDGVKNFGYATDNAGWTHSDNAILRWSDDSKKIATFQQDERKTGDMYLVSTNVGQPKLEQWKYPLPGDANITTIQRVIIEVDQPKVIRLQMLADQHRSTTCDDVNCDNGWEDVQWSADGKTLGFISTSRDHKQANLRVADAQSGSVRDVFNETIDTQYEAGQGAANWKYLPESNEFIWFSEKDGWGHLYLYDLASGKLKNQITKGDWAVWQIKNVDAKNRTIYFNAGGREAGQDPYFGHFYAVDFAGKNVKLLTPEDGNHVVKFSPDGKYFVDNYSKPDVAPVSNLREMNGRLVATLETADVSRLKASGWKPAIPIIVKARDGVTDLYGLMFTPTNLDPSKKYPIINNIYPGPQGGSIGASGSGARSFTSARGDDQALAELGFIVVAIDGTCNPLRSKKFHDACYGNMADNTLPDQVEAMKQLAAKYPYIDLEKVGIWGHSGGGFATAAAMFRFPDFFKVGISESGNHDNRNYEDDWGERYTGLLAGDNYDKQANQNYAKNLKGKLLLAHGTMDDNVPPSNTLLVVDALIKANKDFDLLLIPNARHGYGSASYYMMRRRWDYFIKYLMNAEPPKEYEIKPPPTRVMMR